MDSRDRLAGLNAFTAVAVAAVPEREAHASIYLGAEILLDAMTASDLHVYPSRPYLAAHSLLEAMAAGCVVLAWESEPVREIITHERTGLLAADMAAAEQFALAALADPGAHRPLGVAAASLVREQYDQEVTLPALAAWFTQLAFPGG